MRASIPSLLAATGYILLIAGAAAGAAGVDNDLAILGLLFLVLAVATRILQYASQARREAESAERGGDT